MAVAFFYSMIHHLISRHHSIGLDLSYSFHFLYIPSVPSGGARAPLPVLHVPPTQSTNVSLTGDSIGVSDQLSIRQHPVKL